MATPSLHPVLKFVQDDRNVAEALARFAPGERVADHDGHSGTVQALYGAGPVFNKMIVFFDCGIRLIVRDYELEQVAGH